MTLTSVQIKALKKVATAPVSAEEFARLQADMEVLHTQIISALGPALLNIVASAQLALLAGHGYSQILMQMYTAGFAMGVTFAEQQELERIGRL